MRKHRPIHCCYHCRRRRIRCDKVRPTCNQCRRACTPCTYPTNSTDSVEIQRDVTTREEVFGNRPRGSVDRICSDEAHPGQPPSHRHSQDATQLWSDFGHRSFFYSPTFGTTPARILCSPSDVFSQSQPAHATQSGQIAGEPLSDPRPPSWSDSNPRESNVSDMHGSQLQPDRLENAQVDLDTCVSCGRAYKLECLLGLLPSPNVCAKLCKSFVTTVYPLMPVIQLSSFFADYHILSEELTGCGPHTSKLGSFLNDKPDFVSLYFSVLFAGLTALSTSRTLETQSEDLETSPQTLYLLSNIALKTVSFPTKPSLYTLAAYVITETMLIQRQNLTEPPAFTTTAVRVALRLRLNRESTYFGLSKQDAEPRRRLWCHIIYLDAIFSAASGVSPLLIEEQMANVAIISPYADGVEGTPGQSCQVDTRYLVTVSRYTITNELTHALRSYFDNDIRNLDQLARAIERLDQMTSKVNDVMKALLDSLKGRTGGEDGSQVSPPKETKTPAMIPRALDMSWTLQSASDAPEVRNFISFAILWLHMTVHKAYCFLFQALSKHETLASNTSVRTRAIHHAQAFLRMFVRIWKDQSLKSYSWLYSLNNQLKKSLSRLLAEVLENPNTEESLTSLELIDVTLRLYETSILVAGKTWAPLMQMRRKALERSGLDPHVFHSSQSGLTSGCLCGLVINLDTPVRPEDAIHGVGERDSILLDRQNSYPFGSAQVLTPSLDTTVVDPTSFLPVPFTWYDWDTVGVPSTQLDI